MIVVLSASWYFGIRCRFWLGGFAACVVPERSDEFHQKHLWLFVQHHGQLKISTENVESTLSDNSLICWDVVALTYKQIKAKAFVSWNVSSAHSTAQMERDDLITCWRHFCQVPLNVCCSWWDLPVGYFLLYLVFHDFETETCDSLDISVSFDCVFRGFSWCLCSVLCSPACFSLHTCPPPALLALQGSQFFFFPSLSPSLCTWTRSAR